VTDAPVRGKQMRRCQWRLGWWRQRWRCQGTNKHTKQMASNKCI